MEHQHVSVLKNYAVLLTKSAEYGNIQAEKLLIKPAQIQQSTKGHLALGTTLMPVDDETTTAMLEYLESIPHVTASLVDEAGRAQLKLGVVHRSTARLCRTALTVSHKIIPDRFKRRLRGFLPLSQRMG